MASKSRLLIPSLTRLDKMHSNSSITVYYKREALECDSEIVFRIMMRLNAWPYKFLSQDTQHSLLPGVTQSHLFFPFLNSQTHLTGCIGAISYSPFPLPPGTAISSSSLGCSVTVVSPAVVAGAPAAGPDSGPVAARILRPPKKTGCSSRYRQPQMPRPTERAAEASMVNHHMAWRGRRPL